MEVVVPPADDGGVAGAGKDANDSPGREGGTAGTGGVGAAVAAVLVVVIIASLAVVATRFVRGTDSEDGVLDRTQQLFGGDGAGSEDDRATRETVMRQDSQFVIRVNTYGPSDLDTDLKMPGYVERVSELMTAKFLAGFEQNVTLAEQTVSTGGIGRSADLFASGVQSLSADAATVLVAGSITTSYPSLDPDDDPDQRMETPAQPFRFVIDLILTEGEWLVDDFCPVSGCSTFAGNENLPTQPPTSSPQPGSPTGGPPVTGAPTSQSPTPQPGPTSTPRISPSTNAIP